MESKLLFDELGKYGITIPDEQQRKIKARIDAITSYTPRVGIFGKTGAGKSSLCNALFGKDLCQISDVQACTRNPQEVLLSFGQHGIVLLDVPGVGESQDRDEEYTKLYQSLIGEKGQLDLVLWVLKADDRAYSSDQMFYQNVVKPHMNKGLPFFIVLNQVDKVEPFREWNESDRKPGPRQRENIEAKFVAVSNYFGIAPNRVIPVSANERYNLVNLVDTLVDALPTEKQVRILDNVRGENISVETREKVGKSWIEKLVDIIFSVPLPLPFPIPGGGTGGDIVRTVVSKAVSWVVSKVSSWFR